MSHFPSRQRVLDLYKSGELQRMAQGRTRQEFLAELGISRHAYRAIRNRLKATGVELPLVDELVGSSSVRNENRTTEKMDPGKKQRLEAAGWKCGEVGEFLDEVMGPVESDGSIDVDLSDLDDLIPDGHRLRGKSILIDAEGRIKQQWIKTVQTAADRSLDTLPEVMRALAEPWRGKSELVSAPEISDDELCCLYPLGDPHFGLYAWAEECGDSFDLEIAERNLCSAVDHLVSLAPPAKHALLVSLGDFYHADSAAGTTTAGTRVDTDTRWSKVLRAGVRAMRRIIDRLLEKHETVRVICEIGNHDTSSSAMLGICLGQFYENSDRVQIDTSPAKFHWFRFGDNLIGTTHGDTVRLDKLPGIMACDRAKDWGETVHRRFLVGHVHHSQVREMPGCTVETFQTLAAKDAWHAAQGYRSNRSMCLDVIHRKHGTINRHVVGIAQLVQP